jgi:hypothetical protein
MSGCENQVVGDNVRDWVLPVVTAERRSGGVHVAFRGTGFLLKDSETVITARHVARSLGDGPAGVLVPDSDNAWRLHVFTDVDEHTTEDMASLTLPGGDRGSPIVLDALKEEHSAMQYMLFGYPIDVQYEVIAEGSAMPRPDLVYAEGYVRRRLTNVEVPSMPGSRFYELSAPAGSGFSGAPMIRRPSEGLWHVVGVYVGQRTNETEDVRVGYATRLAGDPWAQAIAARLQI